MRATKRELPAFHLRALVFLVGGVSGIVATVATSIWLGAYRNSVKAAGWVETKGVIENTHLSGTASPSTLARTRTSVNYRLDVHYRYEIGGTPYQGGRLVMGFQPGSARDLWLRFRPGRAVSVFYDPRDPGESCLLRSPPEFPVTFAAVSGIFVAISLVCFGAIWRWMRR